MTTCVPIKDMKSTTAFADLVERSDGPVIVTRNGRDAFAVLRMDDLQALEQEAARAHLYALVDEAEEDIANDRVSEAFDSMSAARARYGL